MGCTGGTEERLGTFEHATSCSFQPTPAPVRNAPVIFGSSFIEPESIADEHQGTFIAAPISPTA
jgi:hypothetical protein